jgi:large subunit ribosomal protein L31
MLFVLALCGGYSLIFSFLKFERFLIMKKDIHPKYEDATISCACGNVITTRSTKKEMSVNTCSACHPYFTGQQTMLDTEGRVDSFMKRYNMKKA